MSEPLTSNKEVPCPNCGFYGGVHSSYCAEVTELKAQIERLTAELEEYKQCYREDGLDTLALKAERDRLAAELATAQNGYNVREMRDLVYEHKALTRRVQELEAALLKAKRGHYYCEDPWYSCPLAEDGCADERWPKDKCNCGADKFNAEIDALLRPSDRDEGSR